MTDYPRFHVTRSAPDEAFKNYFGARQVELALRLADAWLRRRAGTASTARDMAQALLRKAHPRLIAEKICQVPFAILLSNDSDEVRNNLCEAELADAIVHGCFWLGAGGRPPFSAMQYCDDRSTNGQIIATGQPL